MKPLDIIKAARSAAAVARLAQKLKDVGAVAESQVARGIGGTANKAHLENIGAAQGRITPRVTNAPKLGGPAAAPSSAIVPSSAPSSQLALSPYGATGGAAPGKMDKLLDGLKSLGWKAPTAVAGAGAVGYGTGHHMGYGSGEFDMAPKAYGAGFNQGQNFVNSQAQGQGVMQRLMSVFTGNNFRTADLSQIPPDELARAVLQQLEGGRA